MEFYTFTYPSVLDSEARMLDVVRDILADHGVDPAARYPILVCLSESFTNALIHGNQLDPKKVVTVTIRINKEELHADITDQGREGITRIENRRPSTLLAEGGRGIEIIRHYANSVTLKELDTGGLQVSMSFRLAGQSNKTLAK